MLDVGTEVGLSGWIVYYLASSIGLSTLWIGVIVGRFGSSISALLMGLVVVTYSTTLSADGTRHSVTQTQ